MRLLALSYRAFYQHNSLRGHTAPTGSRRGVHDAVVLRILGAVHAPGDRLAEGDDDRGIARRIGAQHAGCRGIGAGVDGGAAEGRRIRGDGVAVFVGDALNDDVVVDAAGHRPGGQRDFGLEFVQHRQHDRQLRAVRVGDGVVAGVGGVVAHGFAEFHYEGGVAGRKGVCDRGRGFVIFGDAVERSRVQKGVDQLVTLQGQGVGHLDSVNRVAHRRGGQNYPRLVGSAAGIDGPKDLQVGVGDFVVGGVDSARPHLGQFGIRRVGKGDEHLAVAERDGAGDDGRGFARAAEAALAGEFSGYAACRDLNAPHRQRVGDELLGFGRQGHTHAVGSGISGEHPQAAAVRPGDAVVLGRVGTRAHRLVEHDQHRSLAGGADALDLEVRLGRSPAPTTGEQ